MATIKGVVENASAIQGLIPSIDEKLIREKYVALRDLIPPKNLMVELAKHGQASVVCRHLVDQLNLFQSELDPEHDIAMNLVAFGANYTLYVDNLGYQDPHLIYFRGHIGDGTPTQLIQHVQQLSFLLTSVKRENPKEPRKPIGFWQPESAPTEQPE